MRFVRSWRRQWLLFAFGAFVCAGCDLNPQPLPPEANPPASSGASSSNGGSSGTGNYGSATDGAVADARPVVVGEGGGVVAPTELDGSADGEAGAGDAEGESGAACDGSEADGASDCGDSAIHLDGGAGGHA